MKFSAEVINEIAQDLDCGLVCYVNLETKEFKSIIDPDHPNANEEYWRADLDEIESWNSYVEVERMSSRDSFEVMKEFAHQVSNSVVKNKLIYGLNRKKPFKNFRYELDYYDDFLQEWYSFIQKKYEEWVERFLRHK